MPLAAVLFVVLRSFEDQNLTSLNTGAVEVFTLDFLSFRFDRLNYSVPEGDTLRFVWSLCVLGRNLKPPLDAFKHLSLES